MLHGFPCLPRVLAAADIAQPCRPATILNFYRRHRYLDDRPTTSTCPWAATVSVSASWPASEQNAIRNEVLHIAPWLTPMLLAPVLHLGMPNARMRPRGDRLYRSPAAAPLSLKPDGHFQPAQWLNLAGPGGHWLDLDVPSTGIACGAIGGATETHGDLW